MQVIENKNLCPYFNLAAEQYFLEKEGDFFLIWRNDRSVIIGKNQNAFSETDIEFAKKNDIKIVRRLTGGGAVFHDKGNINYTFITDDGGNGIDFSRFTAPICEALAQFGIRAELNGRNDLYSGDRKISGNAQCVYDTKDGRKRLLHHGTLLFSADISKMTGVLRVKKEKLASKGVKSVPSRVINICDIDSYCGPRSPEKLMESLLSFAQKKFNVEKRELSEEEKTAIGKISDEKFSLWDWNFGKSPEYNNKTSKRFPYGTVEICFESKNGIISSIEISGDFFGVSDMEELCGFLTGTKLIKEELTEKLSRISDYISGATPLEIADLILN